jgi:alpha-L-fucosidase
MAQTPEAKVKGFIKKELEKAFEDMYTYKPPGGMFGNTGAPDGFYLWHHVFFAIEAKADGNEPTVLQWRHLRHIARQGGVAAVVTGKDLVKMDKLISLVKKRAKAYENAISRLSMADEEQGTSSVSSSD